MLEDSSKCKMITTNINLNVCLFTHTFKLIGSFGGTFRKTPLTISQELRSFPDLRKQGEEKISI